MTGRYFSTNWARTSPGLDETKMSEQETKKEKQDSVAGQSVQTDISRDIEDALSFIETDEYETRPPEPGPAVEIDPEDDRSVAKEKVPEQETVPLNAIGKKTEAPPIQEGARPFVRQAAVTTGGSAKSKGSKTWILLAGVAVLLILVYVFCF